MTSNSQNTKVMIDLPMIKNEVNFDPLGTGSSTIEEKPNNKLSIVDTNDMNNSNVNSARNEILSDKKIYGNPLSKRHPHKIGRSYAFLYINNYPLIIIGPDFSVPLILMACVTIGYILIHIFIFPKSVKWLNVGETWCYLVYMISHALTMLVNQGVPSYKYIDMVTAISENEMRNGGIDTDFVQQCNLCGIRLLKKDNGAHCTDCGVCVLGHDHHCPWTSKCVGRYNKYFFYIFTTSIFIFIFFTFSIVFFALLNMISK